MMNDAQLESRVRQHLKNGHVFEVKRRHDYGDNGEPFIYEHEVVSVGFIIPDHDDATISDYWHLAIATLLEQLEFQGVIEIIEEDMTYVSYQWRAE